MESYDTLTEAIAGLRSEGYTEDFSLKTDSLYHPATDRHIHPNKFEIDKFYRFEGMTDPGDEMILYAISSEDHKWKGILVNGYGVYEDPLTNTMARKLTIHR